MGLREGTILGKMATRKVPGLLVDDPVLAQLYAEWQKEDPRFEGLLEESRLRMQSKTKRQGRAKGSTR